MIEALKLGQSASAIEAAIAARAWSSEKDARHAAQTLLTHDPQPVQFPSETDLEQAMLAGRVLSHAQGFRLLRAASDEFNWALDLGRIAEIWRAGCIIRSGLLDDFATALRSDMPFGHMILSSEMRDILARSIGPLRRVVAAAVLKGIPVPALSGALSWYDSLGRARGSTNLIQAQRDFFGAHGFERLDRDGKHHGNWS